MSRRQRPIDRWERPVDMAHGAGCYVLDCGRKVIAKGMCWNHYQRARRGHPVFVLLGAKSGHEVSALYFGPPKPPKSVLRMARISWEVATNYTPEPMTGCFIWLGAHHPNGYGWIGRQGDPWGRWVHRAVLYFNGVALKRGHHHHVRHLCDQPACVNPAHLVYGTAAENMADRERRALREGWRRGRRGPWKLLPPLVAYIREAHGAGVSKTELSQDLGLHWQTIDRAVRAVAAPAPQVEQNAA